VLHTVRGAFVREFNRRFAALSRAQGLPRERAIAGLAN